MEHRTDEGTLVFARFGDERELNLNEEETELATTAINLLVEGGVDERLIRVVRKSDSYATIVARGEFDEDLLRFKYTPRAKWAAVPMTPENMAANSDNPLFAAQRNRRQLVWKAKLADVGDVSKVVSFAVDFFFFVAAGNPGTFA